MIRRVFKRAAALLLVAGCAFLAAHPGLASPTSSDDLPKTLLDACDERSAPFGRYDAAIAASVRDLTAMGVFASREFEDVRIGFCGLRAANGPAATISCARDSILLDAGYADEGRRLALNVTLAHEMKHHLQHKEQKAALEGYCFSERYRTDRARMEADADAFGDAVGELFFIGRPVEIRNRCPVAVSVYLEPDSPASAIEEQSFLEIAPQSAASLTVRSLTKFFKFYAESAPQDGQRWLWRAPAMTHRRFIDGKAYPLRTVALASASPSDGPFRLSLTCPPQQRSATNP